MTTKVTTTTNNHIFENPAFLGGVFALATGEHAKV
jgi:hypothetical protein